MATALLAAAGTGERLGADAPKALVELAGRPMAWWSLRALAAASHVEHVVIAAPPDYEERLEALAADAAPSLPARVVPGGVDAAPTPSRSGLPRPAAPTSSWSTMRPGRS